MLIIPNFLIVNGYYRFFRTNMAVKLQGK